MFREIATAVKAVFVRKIFVSFFAIEKDELYFRRQFRMAIENARNLNECARARTTIIRTDEANRVEYLRVVMRAQKKNGHGFHIGRSVTRDKIHEFYFPPRRLVRERLSRHLPARKLQLLCNVDARFFDCV